MFARASTSSLVPLPRMKSTSSDGEPVGDRGVVIDDEDFVLGGQGAGQGRPDFTAADDDYVHS